MKERILYNWNAQRAFYVLAGILMTAGSAAQREWLGILPGVYFVAMGVFTFGCAAPGGCYRGRGGSPSRRGRS